jgi:hypothetical protein
VRVSKTESRQLKWRNKMLAEGRCMTCGNEADGRYCKKHLRMNRRRDARYRERMRPILLLQRARKIAKELAEQIELKKAA